MISRATQPESRLESNLAAKVMILLKEIAAGKAQLGKLLGHQTVFSDLHRQVKRLMVHEYIEMTLPEVPNSRLQKYKLTNLRRSQFEV